MTSKEYWDIIGGKDGYYINWDYIKIVQCSYYLAWRGGRKLNYSRTNRHVIPSIAHEMHMIVLERFTERLDLV